MTLVIAAESDDFLVLGTDSRGTILDAVGNRVELNVVKKIFPVADHVAIQIYGDTDQANYMVRKLSPEIKPRMGVTSVAEKFAAVCRKTAKDVRDVPYLREAFPVFGFIISGLDKSTRAYDTPCCYTLNSLSGFRLGFSRTGFGINGKPMLAYYLFRKRYERGMLFHSLCGLVAQTIYETIQVDGDVGGDIKMAIIRDSGVRELDSSEVGEYFEKW